MIKMEHKLITWTCKCGATYGLEPIAPTTLWAKHKERAKCQKKVGANDKECGQSFPDQTMRDKLFNLQYGILEV